MKSVSLHCLGAPDASSLHQSHTAPGKVKDLTDTVAEWEGAQAPLLPYKSSLSWLQGGLSRPDRAPAGPSEHPAGGCSRTGIVGGIRALFHSALLISITVVKSCPTAGALDRPGDPPSYPHNRRWQRDNSPAGCRDPRGGGGEASAGAQGWLGGTWRGPGCGMFWRGGGRL